MTPPSYDVPPHNAASGTLKLAVFGDPVAHSLSPRIHQAFARQCRIAVDYRAQHVTAAQLEQALQAFAAAGGAGLNLTVPHKTTVIAYCHELTPRARAAGAVNTLLRTARGWCGDNTDGAGLVWDLRDQLGWQLGGRPLLIVGAGGAAAGVLPALLEFDWNQVVLANRNVHKAQHWATQYAGRVRPCALAEVRIAPDTLVINATSCGHQGICPPLPAQALHCDAYDLNYGPAAQPFLAWARNAGVRRRADGLGMLMGQAAEAFALWSGQQPAAAQVLAGLRRELAGET